MKLLSYIVVIVMSVTTAIVHAGPMWWMNKSWKRSGSSGGNRGGNPWQNNGGRRNPFSGGNFGSYNTQSEEPSYILYGDQPQDGSYQVRQYSGAYWTSATINGPTMDAVNPFMMLFQYISGNNQQNASIAMTVPVTTTFRHRPCLLCDRSYTMSFYIPQAFQASPPIPRDSRVFNNYSESLIVYVRTFSGWAKELDYQVNAQELMKSLENNGIDLSTLETDLYYGASYDSPMKWRNRRNEVWIVQKQS